jgi:hypothetical protein
VREWASRDELSVGHSRCGDIVSQGGALMPVTTKEKMEFVYAMSRHSTVTLHDCIRIMRYAATVQCLAETACNRELTPKEIRKDERVQMDIIDIVAPHDIEVKFSGDPRGCVVKLVVPDGYTNDWGAEGICVPA